jgi:hypothetical protein
MSRDHANEPGSARLHTGPPGRENNQPVQLANAYGGAVSKAVARVMRTPWGLVEVH